LAFSYNEVQQTLSLVTRVQNVTYVMEVTIKSFVTKIIVVVGKFVLTLLITIPVY